MKNEGKLIYAERLASGLTQTRAAKKLGMTAQFLGRIEKGGAHLPTRHINRFCKITGCPVKKVVSARVRDFKIKLREEIGL